MSQQSYRFDDAKKILDAILKNAKDHREVFAAVVASAAKSDKNEVTLILTVLALIGLARYNPPDPDCVTTNPCFVFDQFAINSLEAALASE